MNRKAGYKVLVITIVLVMTLNLFGISSSIAKPVFQANEAKMNSDMPGYPVPKNPIPHHDPGKPSNAMDYAWETSQINAAGEDEKIQLQGLDALLASGTISDPLQGNYRMVDLDQILIAGNDHAGNVDVET